MAKAKVAAEQFVRGVKAGVVRANRGHSPVGPIGSGRVGRRTYSVKGGPRAMRAGVHAGVAGAQAPLIATAAAAGAAEEHHHIYKSAFGVQHA